MHTNSGAEIAALHALLNLAGSTTVVALLLALVQLLSPSHRHLSPTPSDSLRLPSQLTADPQDTV